jgi:myo-inositol-hexaphosphate 3-phosphohydrolase
MLAALLLGGVEGPSLPGQFTASAATAVSPKLGPLLAEGNADDPAIWIHPTDPSKSLIFGSDKDAGIFVYDFNGNLLQHVNFGTRLNNIDVRYGFRFGNQIIDILAGNLRAAGKLAVLRINPDHGGGKPPLTVLADQNSSGNEIQKDSYGFTLYRRPSDGAVFAFEKPKKGGRIAQYLIDGSSGTIRLSKVREITDVSIGTAEGFVADDLLGFVYFAEESEGIHKYNADPDSSNLKRLAFFAQGDGISGDREGLALYACNDGSGYLVLSSQGNSTFKVYDRQGNNALVKTFSAEKASGTDGLDVTSMAAPGFPNGFAVIHDDPGARYFVYDWADVAGNDLKICPNGGPGGTPPPTLTPPPTATPPPPPTATTPPPPPPGGDVPPPNFTVAFIADQGLGSNARAVLQLIKDEGGDMVVHMGDFDYKNDPDAWDKQINDILGPDFPYFITVGNHDTGPWGGSDGYQAKFQQRLSRIPGVECSGDLGVKSTCTYKGFTIVLSGVGTKGSGHESYIQQQLAASDSTWRICAWHKNMRKMQVGGKGDETGWGVYEACREGAAIVATGHEHSYSRTYLMSSFQNQSIATKSSTLVIEPGKSFAFVSGLGGKGIRNQDQDWPWMAAVYTSDQDANYGALICHFNDNGDPNHATCYFKDIDGMVPDQFELVSALAGPAPPPTPTPTQTVTPTPTEPGGDYSKPTILSFDVQPRSGEGPFKVSWSVSDRGGSHLRAAQVFRAADKGGQPNPQSWHIRPALGAVIEGGQDQASGGETETPPPGNWWYALAVADQAGNWTFGEPILITRRGGGGGEGSFQPFGTVKVDSAFELNGAGSNVDSIAFWEAPNPADTLMFVTGKDNNLVEVWKYPFKGNELPALQPGHKANGVLVDQRADILYVAGGGKVTRYALPSLRPLGEFGQPVGGGETNLALLYHSNGQTWIYVTSDHEVHIFNAANGQKIGSFSPPVVSIETVWADSFHQIVYVPEEQGAAGNEGIYAYHPDGTPYEKNGTNRFANGPFDADEEGIVLYTCPANGLGDEGTGFIIVSDQSDPYTDFEFFDRQSWEHLGALRIEGVNNTDGIASTQLALPDYPMGLFAAIDDDTLTVAVGWDSILAAAGLQCGEGGGGPGEPAPGSFNDVPTDHWAFGYIERLYRDGIVKGCSTEPGDLQFCPAKALKRAEMAVFTLRGKYGAAYQPNDPPAPIFNDVPMSHWAVDWTAKMWEDKMTAGCGISPLRYCPENPHRTEEAAVFFTRIARGSTFIPPEPKRTVFADQPSGWSNKWVMYAFENGLIAPCQFGAQAMICPSASLIRAQAAYSMTRALGLDPIP